MDQTMLEETSVNVCISVNGQSSAVCKSCVKLIRNWGVNTSDERQLLTSTWNPTINPLKYQLCISGHGTFTLNPLMQITPNFQVFKIISHGVTHSTEANLLIPDTITVTTIDHKQTIALTFPNDFALFALWNRILREAMTDMIFQQVFASHKTEGFLFQRALETAILRFQTLVDDQNSHYQRLKLIWNIKIELQEILELLTRDPKTISREEVKCLISRIDSEELLAKDSQANMLKRIESKMFSKQEIDSMKSIASSPPRVTATPAPRSVLKALNPMAPRAMQAPGKKSFQRPPIPVNTISTPPSNNNTRAAVEALKNNLLQLANELDREQQENIIPINDFSANSILLPASVNRVPTPPTISRDSSSKRSSSIPRTRSSPVSPSLLSDRGLSPLSQNEICFQTATSGDLITASPRSSPVMIVARLACSPGDSMDASPSTIINRRQQLAVASMSTIYAPVPIRKHKPRDHFRTNLFNDYQEYAAATPETVTPCTGSGLRLVETFDGIVDVCELSMAHSPVAIPCLMDAQSAPLGTSGSDPSQRKNMFTFSPMSDIMNAEDDVLDSSLEAELLPRSPVIEAKVAEEVVRDKRPQKDRRFFFSWSIIILTTSIAFLVALWRQQDFKVAYSPDTITFDHEIFSGDKSFEHFYFEILNPTNTSELERNGSQLISSAEEMETILKQAEGDQPMELVDEIQMMKLDSIDQHNLSAIPILAVVTEDEFESIDHSPVSITVTITTRCRGTKGHCFRNQLQHTMVKLARKAIVTLLMIPPEHELELFKS